MKKIGYISWHASKKEIEKLTERVTYLVFSDNKIAEEDSFISFLTTHREKNIVIYSFDSVGEGMTLHKIKPSLELITQYKTPIEIIDKGMGENLTDIQYVKFMLELIEKDSKARSYETTTGIKKAQQQGKSFGRPGISDEQIKRIKELRIDYRKTYREISAMLDISLGTVYKYAEDKF